MSLFGIGGLGAGFGRLGAISLVGPSSPVSIATNSLVLASASSQFLSATGKTNINQQKFYWNLWFKSNTAGNQQPLFTFSDGTTNNQVFAVLGATGTLRFSGVTGASTSFNLVTIGTFADGNWHNAGFAMDTTQATANNRGIIYADGTAAALTTNNQPAQNTNLANSFASTYQIGQRNNAAFFNGKLAQVYYIDGQQLTPTSFITGTPGVPKTYSGTFTGNFDFFLPFSNAGSLGADSSGEGNNWTPQNSPTQSTDHP